MPKADVCYILGRDAEFVRCSLALAGQFFNADPDVTNLILVDTKQAMDHMTQRIRDPETLKILSQLQEDVAALNIEVNRLKPFQGKGRATPESGKQFGKVYHAFKDAKTVVQALESRTERLCSDYPRVFLGPAFK